MWGKDARAFLERVVPWPADPVDGPGYVNIHYMQSYGKGAAMFGRPYKTVQAAIAGVGRLLLDKKVTDIYFCLSLQAKTEQTKKGWTIAARHAVDALLLKALWIDIDVKPGEPAKGYETFEDAMKAFLAFRKEQDLPPPSMMVASGGGLHVYWTFKEAVGVEEWKDLAERLKTCVLEAGLKCDAHITADAARILRVPETFNCKQPERRPVRLVWSKGPDYSIAELSASLTRFERTRSTQTGSTGQPDFDLTALAGASPSPLLANENIETGSEGLEASILELDTAQVLKGCPFLWSAIKTGGKGFTEPLWDLTTLASVFMKEGRQLAHAMAKGHDDYSPETTDDKFDRKEAWVEETKGGWPTCTTIKSAGCKDCAVCPNFGKIKSPLSLGIVRSVTPVALPAGVTPELVEQAQDLMLPEGYILDADGIISAKDPKSGSYTRLFQCKISDPQIHLPYGLSFTCTVGMNTPNHVMINKEDIGIASTGMLGILQKQGVSPELGHPNPTKAIGIFLMAWITMLENRKKMARVKTIGWVEGKSQSNHTGFAYGGRMWYSDGSADTPVGYNDPVIRQMYEPVGSTDAWKTAVKLTLERNRPDLAAIVAASFAAPLTPYAGQTGSMICACGNTGIGKTTASLTGAAVWGHPRGSRLALGSTVNHFGGKLSKTVSLPVYWDELKEPEHYVELIKATFSITQGVDKGRSNRDGSIRESGTWKTMLVATCNQSFYGELVRTGRHDPAALYRIFEYDVFDDDGKSEKDHYLADSIIGDMDNNYGQVGLEYIKYVVRNEAAIHARVHEVGREFDRRFDFNKPERFWSNVAATTLVGAEIARDLGLAKFDVPSMFDFLLDSARILRKRVGEETIDSASSLEELLTTFFKSQGESTIVTDTAPVGAGRSRRIIVFKSLDRFAKGGVNVQFLKNDMLVRVSVPAFDAWAGTTKKMSVGTLYSQMKKHYDMKKDRLTLGAGTEWAKGQERIFELSIKEGSEMHKTLLAMAPNKDEEVPLVKRTG